MENFRDYLKDITAKDEIKALKAAEYLLNTADIKLFEELCKKSEFLFDFIKSNVEKRIEKAVSADNYKNILRLFEVYSQDYDELFASLLARYASEELTDEIFEFLETGTIAQKTYAAKYFTKIPDTVALELLQNYAFSDEENLDCNSAQALGKMNDTESFNKALILLGSEDDFDKLKGVKFFAAYSKNPPLSEIFEAMKLSNMPENIAGELPYIASLVELFATDNKKNVLITLENIIIGLGEILPLSQVFQFELYEMFALLIDTNKSDNKYRSKIAEILLRTLIKFRLLLSSDEYTFDEDKNTKKELADILNLLESQSEDFWAEQKKFIVDELSHCKHRVVAALEVIKDIELKEASDNIVKLIDFDNEIVVCEAVGALRALGNINKLDKSVVMEKISDSNIKAIVENYWR